MSKTKEYLDDILEYIAPKVEEADKILRALESRSKFNASGFSILTIPEYATLVAFLARCLVDNSNFSAPSDQFRNPRVVDAQLVQSLLFPDEFGVEPDLPHDASGKPINKKDMH